MNRRLLLLPVIGLLVSVVPARVVAQARSTVILAEARDSIEQGAFEPALTLIDKALEDPASLPVALRVRAFVLEGLTLTLIGGRDDEAIASFIEALSLDRSVSVDSLQSLSNQLLRVFRIAKTQLAQMDSVSFGELEIRGLPPRGVQLAVDDTAWSETKRDVAPGWRHIVVTGAGYLPYKDSVLVDTAGSVVWVVNLVHSPLTLSFAIPDRVTVPASAATYHVVLVTGRRSLTTVTLQSADGRPISSDTQTVSGRSEVGVALRGAGGAIPAAGRYLLRASAVDDEGAVSEAVDRYILLSRGAVDTVPAPQPPPASSFLPETLTTHPGPAAPALASVLLAAATIAGPSLLGNRDLGPSATRSALAFAVGGSIAISGVVGFFSGKMPHPSDANIRQNAERRAAYAGALADAAQANNRLRDDAPIVVRADHRAPWGPRPLASSRSRWRPRPRRRQGWS